MVNLYIVTSFTHKSKLCFHCNLTITVLFRLHTFWYNLEAWHARCLWKDLWVCLW